MSIEKPVRMRLGVVRKSLRRHKKYSFVKKEFTHIEQLPVSALITDTPLNVEKEAWAYDVVIQEKETGRRFGFELYSVPEVSDRMFGWSDRCAALTNRSTAVIEGRETSFTGERNE